MCLRLLGFHVTLLKFQEHIFLLSKGSLQFGNFSFEPQVSIIRVSFSTAFVAVVMIGIRHLFLSSAFAPDMIYAWSTSRISEEVCVDIRVG